MWELWGVSCSGREHTQETRKSGQDGNPKSESAKPESSPNDEIRIKTGAGTPRLAFEFEGLGGVERWRVWCAGEGVGRFHDVRNGSEPGRPRPGFFLREDRAWALWRFTSRGGRTGRDCTGTLERRWIGSNQRGTPYLKYDEHRWEASKERLKYPRVVLTREQMVFVEGAIPGVCERGHWKLHACAAGPEHVHVVLTTKFDPESARRLLKRWVRREMAGRWDLGGREDRTWLAECAGLRVIEDEAYFRAARTYVQRQRQQGWGKGAYEHTAGHTALRSGPPRRSC